MTREELLADADKLESQAKEYKAMGRTYIGCMIQGRADYSRYLASLKEIDPKEMEGVSV